MKSDKVKSDEISGSAQTMDIEISEKQIEIFARRLLPEIKRFFADENVKKEFEEWQKNQNRHY